MGRLRKPISYLITVVLIVLFFFLIADTWLLDKFENAVSGGGTTTYTMISAAEDGTVCALGRRESDYVLAKGDCNGGHARSKTLSMSGLPEHFEISDMFALPGGDILLSLYELDSEGNAASLNLYSVRDGSGSLSPLLSVDCAGGASRAAQKASAGFLGFSCYYDEARFLLWKGGLLTGYKLETDDMNLSALGSFTCERPKTALPLADGSIALGMSGGEIKVLSGMGAELYTLNVGGTVSGLYQGTDGFFLLDAPAKSICGISQSGEDYYRLQQFAVDPELPLAVQPEGIVLWLDDGELMKNDSAVTTPLSSALYGSTWTSRLLLVLCVCVVFALSALIYRFLYGKNRIHLSLLVKNGVVLALLLAAVFTLGKYAFLPVLVSRANAQAEENVKAAACLAVELGGSGDVCETVAESLSDAGLYGAEATLYSYAPDGYEVIDSNAGLEPGTISAGNTELRNASSQGVDCASYEDINGASCRAVASYKENLLELKVNISDSADSAKKDYGTLIAILAAERACCVLIILYLLLQLWGGIHRIVCGMRYVSNGVFDVEVVNPSGDELEDIAKSFNNMALTLKKGQEQSRQIGENYMRFIPEDTINLMGVQSLEDVTRETVSNHRMVVMTVRFRIPEEGGEERTEGLFNDINAVIEQTTFAAVAFAGNSFNFTYDGYNVVFETEFIEESVRAAIAIQGAAKAINKERERLNRPQIELRVAMDCGLVRMGIVGDELHMVPTAISQCLETNEHLLKVCERIDAHILCTENLLQGMGARKNRYVGKIGGDAPVRVYEVIDGDPYLTAQKKAETMEKFSEAVLRFYARDFATAKRLFMELARYSGRDGAVRFYLDLSDRYENGAPEELNLGER